MNGISGLVEIEEIVIEGLDVAPDRAERIRALVEIMLPQRLDEQGLLDRLVAGEIALDAPPPLNRELSSLSDREIAAIVVERIVDVLQQAASNAEEHDEGA